MSSLPPLLRSALAECARHNDRGCLYWFRERSMAKLEEISLVEKWLPKSVAERRGMKRRPWRVTAAGRAVLREDSHA